MKKKRPALIIVIAILQIVPIILLPPKLLETVILALRSRLEGVINLLSVSPLMTIGSLGRALLMILLIASPLLIFALLAWALLTLRPPGRTLTIFVQGLNIIVRVLITLARVVPSKAPGTPADVPLLLSSLISIVLSVVILLYVDKPETQLLFEA